jgi:hypothetical protein
MANKRRVPVGKYTTLAIIAGVHVLFVQLLSRNTHRNIRSPRIEPQSILYFFELPQPPPEKVNSEPAFRTPAIMTHAPPDDSTAITSSPESSPNEANVDWIAERERVAREWGKREAERKRGFIMGRAPKGMGPLPKSAGPKRGDVEQLEGGVVREWINDHCYYTNELPPGAPMGQRYDPIKVCKSSGGPNWYQSFEEWQAERERAREVGEELP